MKTIVHELRRNKTLFLMALPAILLTLFLCYVPMPGIILAFKNYRFNLGIFGSPWAGLANFRYFFMSGKGFLVTRNTILYNVMFMITCHSLAVFFAILFCEISGKTFRRLSQSITFLPYFISWIIVGVFVNILFNYESGVLNTVLKSLNMDPVNLYSRPVPWIFIIAFFNAWKWVGYTSVIYIAAIHGIDQECYESADIDGASIFQKMYYLTIPMISRTISVMLLLNVGRILRGDFQMFFQIVGNNGMLFNATDVIDVFVFRSLVGSGGGGGVDLTMSSAATFYQSILCFIIIVIVNGIVRKVDSESALF